MLRVLLTTALLAVVCSTQAQVRVVESAGESGRSDQQSAREGGGGASMQEEMFFRLQALQQEVSELRGLVEEQAYEIQRLQQRRLDDYLDLDRRLSALSAKVGDESPADDDFALSRPGASMPAADPEPVPEQADETEVYQAAYELLRQRQIDEATEAFRDHISRFPDGRYTANSYYWLGEIFLLREELDEAQRWFGDLLDEFPGNRKVPDAEYKLATVYHRQGETQRARELMRQVAEGTSDAARLARRYLEENL